MKREAFRGANRLFVGLRVVAVAVPLGLGGFVLAEGLNTTGSEHGLGIVLGVALLTLEVVVLAQLACWLRGLTIRNDRLSISRGFRTWHLSLAQVAGLGLIYQRTPGNARDYPGWYLNVWIRDGSRYRVPQFGLVALSSPKADASKQARMRSFTAPWPTEVPLPYETEAELAQSRPGRIAAQLDAAVRCVQGERGLLATAQLQKHVQFVPVASPQLLAWWSPDGEMGRTA